MRFISILLFIWTNILYVYSEILPECSIVNLTICAHQVLEARIISQEGNDYIFSVQHLAGEAPTSDTLIINNFGVDYENSSIIQRADKLIIFQTRDLQGNLSPLFGGIRVLIDKNIYFPFQVMNPGGYALVSPKNNISWDKLRINVKSAYRRIDRLRSIKGSIDQNRKLFSFLEREGDTLFERGGYNEDKGWGMYAWEIFNWITSVNNAEDTWRAGEIYRRLHCPVDEDQYKFCRSIQDDNGGSFHSAASLDFLIQKALHQQLAFEERRQALVFLESSVSWVFQNNDPIPDSTTLAAQNTLQRTIRSRLIPLLDDELLKEYAFRVISYLSNPRNATYNHRIDLDILPTIKKLYRQEKNKRLRSEFAEFIVYNSSEEEWKVFSGNDERIFVDLYQVYIDTMKHEMSLSINYNFGTEPMYTKPDIHIESLADGKTLIVPYVGRFDLPYESWRGMRRLSADISSLSKGSYKVYVTRKAGKESSYQWTSEYQLLEI